MVRGSRVGLTLGQRQGGGSYNAQHLPDAVSRASVLCETDGGPHPLSCDTRVIYADPLWQISRA